MADQHSAADEAHDSVRQPSDDQGHEGPVDHDVLPPGKLSRGIDGEDSEKKDGLSAERYEEVETLFYNDVGLEVNRMQVNDGPLEDLVGEKNVWAPA